MPESFYDMVVVLFFTVVPVVLIGAQVIMSTRKKYIWGFIVPILWSALGAWILIKGYLDDKHFSFEMLIVFLIGDAVLLGILALFRYLRRRKRMTGNKGTKKK
jgi:uncharacterized membrane protein YeaQ/YmgE (transglycosylase-associated protein family)